MTLIILIVLLVLVFGGVAAITGVEEEGKKLSLLWTRR